MTRAQIPDYVSNLFSRPKNFLVQLLLSSGFFCFVRHQSSHGESSGHRRDVGIDRDSVFRYSQADI